MPARNVYNFSAGPAVLPEPVLVEAQAALWDLHGSGIGVMEHSHRGKVWGAVYERALADCRKLAAVPDNYEVLFLQGGAAAQFFMLPANFLAANATADYIVTGAWAQKAAQQAAYYGRAHIAWDESEGGVYIRTPDAAAITYSDAPAYVHYTSNNTIFGTQWQQAPAPPAGSWLACDASSDVFSRPVNIADYGLLYAGAQKNLGPAGVTLVIARRELIARPVRELPVMQRYQRSGGALHNTPPTFGIYVMGRVFNWLLQQGGLEAMAARNKAKAKTVYDALQSCGGFYQCTTAEGHRSLMNITFRIAAAAGGTQMEDRFVTEAAAAGFAGLRGHRSVGGMRASLYNAFPPEGCTAFAEFLRHFAARNG